MVEKFADFEGTQWLRQEGKFEFEVMEAELKPTTTGKNMVEFLVKADEGQTKVRFVITDKAKWKYNQFIKACLKLDHISKTKDFMLDYETIHNDLIGKHFVGTVVKDYYIKEIKVPTEDGLYETKEEEKESYNIEEFAWVG